MVSRLRMRNSKRTKSSPAPPRTGTAGSPGGKTVPGSADPLVSPPPDVCQAGGQGMLVEILPDPGDNDPGDFIQQVLSHGSLPQRPIDPGSISHAGQTAPTRYWHRLGRSLFWLTAHGFAAGFDPPAPRTASTMAKPHKAMSRPRGSRTRGARGYPAAGSSPAPRSGGGGRRPPGIPGKRAPSPPAGSRPAGGWSPGPGRHPCAGPGCRAAPIRERRKLKGEKPLSLPHASSYPKGSPPVKEAGAREQLCGLGRGSPCR